jgi:hypothetical protein
MPEAKHLAFRPFKSEPARAFDPIARVPDPDSALVFLDTNVLLAPYQATSQALSAIEDTYRKLRSQERLVVPAQVAREFAHNRPKLVAELHKRICDARSIAISGRLDDIPILMGTTEYLAARKHLATIEAGLKACRVEIDKLVERIGSWRNADPVLSVYSKLFDGTVVCESSVSDDDLEKARQSRYAARIPPGYRDKGKEDGGVGDLAIWLTILDVCAARGRDALFVSEDSKDDWFHRSGDQRLFPRYELAEEFSARTSGKAFGILSLSALLKSHGVSESVVREVKEQEQTSIVPQAIGKMPLAYRAEAARSRGASGTQAPEYLREASEPCQDGSECLRNGAVL